MAAPIPRLGARDDRGAAFDLQVHARVLAYVAAGGGLGRGAVAAAEQHGVDEQREQLVELDAVLVAVGERGDLLVGGRRCAATGRRTGAASPGRPRGGRRRRPGRSATGAPRRRRGRCRSTGRRAGARAARPGRRARGCGRTRAAPGVASATALVREQRADQPLGVELRPVVRGRGVEARAGRCAARLRAEGRRARGVQARPGRGRAPPRPSRRASRARSTRARGRRRRPRSPRARASSPGSASQASAAASAAYSPGGASGRVFTNARRPSSSAHGVAPR